MALALLLARLALAAVFAVAGLAKLADLPGSRRAVRGFGVPEPLAGPLGLLLPPAEIAVAAALVPRASARWGALGALALLLTFCAAIGVNLARGRAPECHCFGQLHSAPAGWPTLARNAALAVLAGGVLWRGWAGAGLSAVGWTAGLAPREAAGLAVGAALVVAVAGEGWLLLHLLRQNGRLLARVEALEAGAAPAAPSVPQAAGLPVGSQAPAFQLPGLYGETLTLDALRAPGKPVVLVFSDPTCGPCNSLMPDLGRWQREEAALTVAVISRGTAAANRAKSVEHGLSRVLLQADREVATAYRAPGTPSAVLVRPDGTIGGALAQGAGEVRALIARETGQPLPQYGAGTPLPLAPPRQGAAPGAPAPAFSLPDLDGRLVDRTALRGAATLVLFWNPECGFCRRMLADLKAWRADPPPGAPRLLVVSAGTAAANRADGLDAPVLLDESFAVGRAFGATGTPSAVLVDADGRIASEVAVGAPAVLALAGAGAPSGRR